MVFCLAGEPVPPEGLQRMWAESPSIRKLSGELGRLGYEHTGPLCWERQGYPRISLWGSDAALKEGLHGLGR
eukprot:11507822-Alexandrium_andersonii.AAC.1